MSEFSEEVLKEAREIYAKSERVDDRHAERIRAGDADNANAMHFICLALTTKSEKLTGLVEAAESLLSYAEEYAAGNDFSEERAAIAAAKGGV